MANVWPGGVFISRPKVMSEASTTAPGGSQKVTKISEAVVRIAGNSQDVIQALG